MTVRIVLAEDHHLVRQGLRALLEKNDDLTIVAETADGLEVARLVEAHQPEILIIDLMLPGLNGMEAARRALDRRPETRVVFLSMHADEAYVLQALKLGASAYVLKDASATDMVRAVKEVMAGRKYLSPPLSQRALDVHIDRLETGELDPYQSLTTREREVLQLTAEGLTNQQMAEKLAISARTIETHRANLMRKLDLESSNDLLRFALKHGLVEL